jgi:hypothetical protein
MNFLSVNKLLRKCNICPSKLILNDNSFYNKMTKVLKNININQVGGDYKINLGDDDYIIIHDYIEENQIFFAFRGKTDNLEENIHGTPCILLLKDEDRMHISQFDVFGNNCLTNNKKILNGSQILFIILKFIESKKDKYKIRYITLVDTSIKYCNGIHISLGDFKILISGDTWYGSYGFEPASNMFGKIKFSSFEKENYENNKKILEKLTINNSYIEEIIKDYKTRKISNKVIKSLDNLLLALSTNSDKNLSVFLKNYFTKETFSEKCLGLGIIIKELFRKNNLVSFENKMFIKKIK